MEYSTSGVLHLHGVAVSVLDTAPKTSVRLLVGRERELREIVSSVPEHRIVVVLGPRRIGKTSIVKTALFVLSGMERVEGLELKYKFVPIYVDMWAVVSVKKSRDYFLQYVCNAVIEALEKHDASLARRFREKVFTREEGVSKKGGIATVFRAEYSREKRLLRPVSLERCLEELNSLLGEHGTKAVLAIDEAQELGSVKPFTPTAWLAHIHDHLNRVHVLLSGSYVGLLKRVLEPRPRDPLYGRDVKKIYVKKLDPESMLEIFTKGLEERGIRPSSKFSESLEWVTKSLKEAVLAQYIPFAEKPHEATIQEKPENVKHAYSWFLKRVEKYVPLVKEYISRRLQGYAPIKPEILAILATLLAFLLVLFESGILSSIMVYEAANLLLRIGFDLSSFSSTFSGEDQEAVRMYAELSRLSGWRALMVLSLFVLSGYPHIMIQLVKSLPDNFEEEDLFEVGLKVLEESYRAVCSEVNKFVHSYSKKPEIVLLILHYLYEKPRTTSELIEALPGVDKKSVIENLKTLLELGYTSKHESRPHTYYFIADPLLFYALKERCISS